MSEKSHHLKTDKEKELNISDVAEPKSFSAAIESLRISALQLETLEKNIPRHLMWIGSWGTESHSISIAAALRFINDESCHISDAELIQGIRYLSARRYNIVAGIIPNILLAASAAKKIGLDKLSVSEIINFMRFITERFIVLRSITEQTQGTNEFSITSYDDFMNFEESVFDTAIGTRFDWSNAGCGFEDMDQKTEYVFLDDNVSRNMSRKNILTLRDRVGRNYPGLIPYYNYCSEFIHPNIGDLEAVGLDLKLLKAPDGHFLRHRHLAILPQLLESQQAARKGSESLLLQCILYSAKIISTYKTDADELISRLTVAERWIDKEIHRLVKRNRHGLDQKDLCPCGSGKTIKQCRNLKQY